MGYPAGEDDGLMNPFARLSLMYLSSSSSSVWDNWYIGPNVGCFPSYSGTWWSQGWCFGNASIILSSSNSLVHYAYSGGTRDLSFLFKLLAFSTLGPPSALAGAGGYIGRPFCEASMAYIP